MSKRKKLFVALVAVAVLAIGGVAVAAWTASGTGSGRAKALTAVDSTVTEDITASNASPDLYPGFTDGDIFVQVDNPNPYAVTFTSFAAGTVTSSVPACVAFVSVDDSGAISMSVPANSPAVSRTIPDVVSLDHAAPDACQGATFTIPLTLTGSQD
jgi:hypothetical protein